LDDVDFHHAGKLEIFDLRLSHLLFESKEMSAIHDAESHRCHEWKTEQAAKRLAIEKPTISD